MACCAGIIFLLAGGAQGGSLTLSGVSIYDSAGTSGLMLSGGWNTQCGAVYQLFLTGITTCPLTAIDISTPGDYTYTYSTTGGLPGQFANLELFFSGDTFAPGIHVVIDRSDLTNPPVLVVPNLFQHCLAFNCSPGPDGAGSLTYSSGSQTVTATKFTEVDSNGSWTGTIQFSVADSGVPEPASLALVGSALLAAPIVLRRRARR
jgi:hypothetical protein